MIVKFSSYTASLVLFCAFQNADHIRATLTIDPSESDPLTAAATQSITEDLQSQNDLDQLASSISTEVVEQAPNNQGILNRYLNLDKSTMISQLKKEYSYHIFFLS